MHIMFRIDTLTHTHPRTQSHGCNYSAAPALKHTRKTKTTKKKVFDIQKQILLWSQGLHVELEQGHKKLLRVAKLPPSSFFYGDVLGCKHEAVKTF